MSALLRDKVAIVTGSTEGIGAAVACRSAGAGSAVNIASAHGHRTNSGAFPYPVVKRALIGLTRALGIDDAARAIRVNSALFLASDEARIGIKSGIIASKTGMAGALLNMPSISTSQENDRSWRQKRPLPPGAM